MAKTRIIFRADGNSQIGLGHVVRSLALAEMLRENFECIFAIQTPDAALQQQIRQACHGIIILPPCSPDEDRYTYELAAYLSEEEIVVLDGYNFKTDYQQKIKDKGCKLVCIDDIHAYPFVADVVINQAGGVTAKSYITSPYTKLLLGPKYALLRQPFLKASRVKTTFRAAELSVLLNMGGADPQNFTLQLAQELTAVASISHIAIVIGSAYLHLPELEQFIVNEPLLSLYHNLSAEAMSRLMNDCHAAITSASGVSYEYAAVGGVLFVKQTADNQQELYKFLVENDIALDYTELKQKLENGLTPDVFQQQVQIQRLHLDGKSDERLKKVFNSLSLSASLTLRDVTKSDLMLLFNWANDAEVRKNSFNQAPIQLEDHQQWLELKLQDNNAYLYIATSASVPIAHIRFDIHENYATVSYLIGAGFRGKSLSHTVLLKGVERLKKQRPEVTQIIGFVQMDNTASVRAFEKAGFVYKAQDTNYPNAFKFALNFATEAN